MTDYRKKYNTNSKIAIDRIKELEKECARLAANCKDGSDIQIENEKLKNIIDSELTKRNSMIDSNDKLQRENHQLREDLAATAIKAINVMTEMRKL